MLCLVIAHNYAAALVSSSSQYFIVNRKWPPLLVIKLLRQWQLRGHYTCAVSRLWNVMLKVVFFSSISFILGWCGGIVVGHQTCDQQVVSSTSGLVWLHSNSEQVSHTHVLLLPSSIIWYQRKLGRKLATTWYTSLHQTNPLSLSASWCLAKGYRNGDSTALWACVAWEGLYLYFLLHSYLLVIYCFDVVTIIVIGH